MPDVTIYDVAERAGVSISTVSRVLNTAEQVNETTRLRVLQAIDELGFVPKAEAAARARKSVRRIGILAPFITYPSFVQRLRGVTMLADMAYDLVIYNVDSGSRRESYLSSLPVTRRLDGLIIMALPLSDEAAQRLLAHSLETVLIEVKHPSFSSIEIDDASGGQLVANYLMARGHRTFGFIGDGSPPDYSIHTSEKRLDGYRSGLHSAGIALSDEYIALGEHSLEQARQLTHTLLSLPTPPTAIFASSDTQALGVLKAARERGIQVPHDLAVVGFDDIDIADYVGLTTVRQPLEESGRVATELLTARMADPSRQIQQVHLPLTLIRRETA